MRTVHSSRQITITRNLCFFRIDLVALFVIAILCFLEISLQSADGPVSVQTATASSGGAPVGVQTATGSSSGSVGVQSATGTSGNGMKKVPIKPQGGFLIKPAPNAPAPIPSAPGPGVSSIGPTGGGPGKSAPRVSERSAAPVKPVQINPGTFNPNRQSDLQDRLGTGEPSSKSQGAAARDIFKRAKNQRTAQELAGEAAAPRKTKVATPNVSKAPSKDDNPVGANSAQAEGTTPVQESLPEVMKVPGAHGTAVEDQPPVSTDSVQGGGMAKKEPPAIGSIDKAPQTARPQASDLETAPKKPPGAPGALDLGAGHGGLGDTPGGSSPGPWKSGYQMPGRQNKGSLEERAWADDSHTPAGGSAHSPAGALGDVGSGLGWAGGFVPGTAGKVIVGVGGAMERADKLQEGSVGGAVENVAGVGGYGVGKFIDYGVSGNDANFQAGAKELGDKAGGIVFGLIEIGLVAGLGVVGIGIVGLLKLTGADKAIEGAVSGVVQDGLNHGKEAVEGDGGKAADEMSAELDGLIEEADKSAKEGQTIAEEAQGEQKDQGDDADEGDADEEDDADESGDEEEGDADEGGESDDADEGGGQEETDAACNDENYENASGKQGFLTQEQAQNLNEKMSKDPTGEGRDAPAPLDLEGFDPNQTNALTGESSNIFDGNKARLSPEQMKEFLLGGEVNPCPNPNLDVTKL